MMRLLLGLGVVLAAGGGTLMAGDVGTLTPAACDPDQVFFPPPLATAMFAGRPEAVPAGLSQRAMVATARVMRPGPGAASRPGEAQAPIRVALDFARPEAEHADLVLLDFTGKDRFDRQSAVAIRPLKPPNKSVKFLGQFGPATFDVARNGRPLKVTVCGAYAVMESGGRSLIQFIFSFLPAAEGSCRFGQKDHAVRVIDCTGDFGFDRKATMQGDRPGNASPGDVVLVDQGDGSFGESAVRAYCGQPVFVDGAWYELTVSPEGDRVAAKPVELPVGTLAVDRDRWEVVLAGAGKAWAISGGRAPVPVPAGKYKLLYYREFSAADARGRRGWLLAAPLPADRGKPPLDEVVVTAGQAAKLALGPPLALQLVAKVQAGNDVEFSLGSPRLQGDLRVVHVSKPGGWLTLEPVDPPEVRILDEAGKPVGALTMEYG